MTPDEAIKILGVAIQHYDENPSGQMMNAVLGCARMVVNTRTDYPVTDLTKLDMFVQPQDCCAALTSLVYHSVILVDGREVILAEDVRAMRDALRK